MGALQHRGHSWCPAHGALWQAAWVFWQETRQHKEILGDDDDATNPLHTPTGPKLGPVSSCVAKATQVVRHLPRADVALPMPFWAITAIRSPHKTFF
jgi:hypothetical protein